MKLTEALSTREKWFRLVAQRNQVGGVKVFPHLLMTVILWLWWILLSWRTWWYHQSWWPRRCWGRPWRCCSKRTQTRCRLWSRLNWFLSSLTVSSGSGSTWKYSGELIGEKFKSLSLACENGKYENIFPFQESVLFQLFRQKD